MTAMKGRPAGKVILGLVIFLAMGLRPWVAAPGVAPPLSMVKNVRHISSGNYTRIVLDLSDKIRYQTHVLERDPKEQLPPRVYIDLIGARLTSEVDRKILVQDQLLQSVRLGQFSPNVVRVVLDMKGLTEHKAFLLPDPYRMVMDIQSHVNGGSVAKASVDVAPGGNANGNGLRLRKIVLDPGHGGKDPGALGPGGVAEKDLVLSIAKKLARKIRDELDVEVVLTRTSDRFVPLEDRTAFANAQNADLFISLHINASTDPRMRGIESYYLDNATDEATIRLAARENDTSRRNISDLQFILSDLTQNSKLEDSIGLAHRLQSSLVSHMRKSYRGVKNLGVKKGLFYVLVGARMPSVLLETFFVTNRYEGRYLARSSFQGAIVEAIFRGIKEYQANLAVAKNL